MRRLLIAASCTLLFVAGIVFSDTYLVQKVHTDGYSVAGTTVPGSDDQSVIWSSGDKIRINSDSDTSMIMRMDKKLLYIVYKQSKTYAELNLAELQLQMEAAKSEVESAIPAGMASMMQFEATVKATKETKKIGKWNCSKYTIATVLPMGTTNTVLWASSDVKINYAQLAKMKNFAMSQMPGFAKMIKEYEKVQGFPVVTESTTSVMGMEIKTREELVEVAEKAAPAGIYDVPAKYTKVALDE